MYKNELDIISQHGWVEGSKYLHLVRLCIERQYDKEDCRKELVDRYGVMKPKEFVSKWNRFQHIKPYVEFVR
tara:strand:+ start:550 stop:765 length:216 start_codon:yes stop_codon:yes gene_type:complete